MQMDPIFGSAKAMRSIRPSTLHFACPLAPRWTPFTRPPLRRAAGTTARQVCGPTTTPTTTARSCSIRTVTTSRPCVTRRSDSTNAELGLSGTAPRPSLHPTAVDEIQCEAALDWRGWGTVPIRSADFITRQPARLPAELVTACALLERRSYGGDLIVDCTDDVARRLTDAMWIRVRELAASGQIPWSLPRDVAELGRALSPFAVAQIVKRVVYDGLEYDPAVEGLERRPLLVRV